MENNIQQPLHTSQNLPHFSKTFIILMVVLITITVGLGGYILGANQNQVVQNQPQPVAQIPQLSPTPVDETADWKTYTKTYTSSRAKYSFKYPQQWPLVNVPVSQGCTACIEDIQFTPSYNPNSGDLTIAVILVNKEDKIKTLEDYVNIHVKGDSSKVNIQDATIGGEKAVSYTLSGGIPPLPIIEYAVVKNGFYYIIRLEDSAETNKNKSGNIEIFNQILSTFKFTDQDQNTSDIPQTGPQTYCSSDKDCWCREFTGAAFVPGGRVEGICNLKTNRCETCFYE